MYAIRRRLSLFVLLALVAVNLSACGAVNQLPTLDEKAKAAWAEVLNQYQRRTDLIPNLVETVKGYATHEQSTLVEVTEARAKATAVTINAGDITQNPDAFKQFEQSQGQLGSALVAPDGRVRTLPRPEGGQELHGAAERSWKGTENRIAVARQATTSIRRAAVQHGAAHDPQPLDRLDDVSRPKTARGVHASRPRRRKRRR